MTVIDFPATPTLNQVFVQSGVQWRWDGNKWVAYSSSTSITSVNAGHGLQGGGSAGAVTLALTVPVAVADGGSGATTASGALSNLGAAPASSLGNYLPLTSGTLSAGLTVINSAYNSGFLAYQGNYGPWVVLFNDGNGHLECSTQLWINGNSTQPITCGGATTFSRRSTFNDGFAIYGGTFYNAFNNGWLYFDGSIRVWDFQCSNNVNAFGRIIVGGLSAYNSSNYFYFENSIHVNECISRNQVQGTYLHSSGDVRGENNVIGGGVYGGYVRSYGSLVADGSLFVNGLQVYNSGGWLYSVNGFQADQLYSRNNMWCGNDASAGGVFRRYGGRGARIECFSTDWDWMAICISGGNLLFSPDFSGGVYVSPTGWFSDACLKENIRDTEIDALAAICGTPVRAFEWSEEGRRRIPWAKPVPIGLVAQDLEETMSFAVGVEPVADNLRYINAQHITPYLVRAIQQLAEQNTALMAALMARIEVLETQGGER